MSFHNYQFFLRKENSIKQLSPLQSMVTTIYQPPDTHLAQTLRGTSPPIQPTQNPHQLDHFMTPPPEWRGGSGGVRRLDQVC